MRLPIKPLNDGRATEMYSGILGPLKKFDEIPIGELSPEVVDLYNTAMAKNETGNRYNMVNKDPASNSGFNVGTAQWRGGRADNILSKLKERDPELANSYIKDIDIRDREAVWKSREDVAKWLDTPSGRQVQDEQMNLDFNRYMDLAKSNGVVGSGAAMVWADLAHRYGDSGAKRFLNKDGPTTLEHLVNELNKLEAAGDRNAPINKTRFKRYADMLGGEAGVILSMHGAARSVLEGRSVGESVADTINYSNAVDLQKIINEASKSSIPELPDTGSPLAQTLSDETSEFKRQFIENLFKPEEQLRKNEDPITILINAVIKYLIGGV